LVTVTFSRIKKRSFVSVPSRESCGAQPRWIERLAVLIPCILMAKSLPGLRFEGYPLPIMRSGMRHWLTDPLILERYVDFDTEV
jgi:hypothetical protein